MTKTRKGSTPPPSVHLITKICFGILLLILAVNVFFNTTNVDSKENLGTITDFSVSAGGSFNPTKCVVETKKTKVVAEGICKELETGKTLYRNKGELYTSYEVE